MATKPNRNERRKARTVGAILQAAERLFREKGMQQTTIDEIAELADVSVGSVYFHFKSKEALYLALVEQALDVNEAYMRQAHDSELSPFDRVLAAGDAYLRFHLEHPGAFRMIALRVLEPSPGAELAAIEDRIADRVEKLVGAVEVDLVAAIEAGEVRDVEAAQVMRFLWGAWNGVIALNLRQDRLRIDNRQLVAVLDAGRQIVVDGLAARPGAERRVNDAHSTAGASSQR
jgi:AcrR family transcriptional regulator